MQKSMLHMKIKYFTAVGQPAERIEEQRGEGNFLFMQRFQREQEE